MPRRRATKSEPLVSPALATYWQRTHEPLQVLFFLLPLIFIYEMALPIFGVDQLRQTFHRDIYARQLLYRFFGMFGVSGHYLPAFIVVVVLLSWHFVRKDKWRFEPETYAWMYVESIVWSLPLFVFLLVLAREPSLQAGVASLTGTGGGPISARAQMMFGLGAGIYEEFFFRLIGIALVHAILVDLLAVPEKVGAAGAIAITALAFAFYHFPGATDIRLGIFLQYFLAGIYLACLYLFRGIGIAAGTHAAYDVLLVLLEVMRHKR